MPAWRRVRDKVTGHQYDIPAETLPLPDGIEEVERHPVIEGPGELPRPSKPHAPKGGATQTPRAERGSRTRDTTTDAPGTPADSKE